MIPGDSDRTAKAKAHLLQRRLDQVAAVNPQNTNQIIMSNHWRCHTPQQHVGNHCTLNGVDGKTASWYHTLHLNPEMDCANQPHHRQNAHGADLLI